MYDLIIVGGGPSGSAAGRIAGKLGLKSLLIEKQTFPRYKPCGGAFSEQAMSYLDFEVPEHIHERNIFGARVHYHKQFIEKHKDYRIATITTRSILDDFLLQKAKEANIEINMGEKVETLKESADKVEVYTNEDRYVSKYVIIAEGAKGRLKYLVREKDKKDAFGIAVVAEIERDNSTINEYIYNAIDIHFGITKMGYGWIFPHENYFSVGIGGLAKNLLKPQDTMKKFLILNGFNGDYKLKTHLVPAGGIKRKLFTSRIVLCGDSAGFVDPFYGEGIAYAIRSGQIAAEIISKIIRLSNRVGTLANYEAMCNIEFGKNLKYSLFLTKLMHNFPNIFLKIFSENDDVIDKYLEIPAVKITYQEYMRWFIPRVPIFLFSKRRKSGPKNVRSIPVGTKHL